MCNNICRSDGSHTRSVKYLGGRYAIRWNQGLGKSPCTVLGRGYGERRLSSIATTRTQNTRTPLSNMIAWSSGLEHSKRFIDTASGKSRTMVCAPILNDEGEILGVIQLVNKKVRARVCVPCVSARNRGYGERSLSRIATPGLRINTRTPLSNMIAWSSGFEHRGVSQSGRGARCTRTQDPQRLGWIRNWLFQKST